MFVKGPLYEGDLSIFTVTPILNLYDSVLHLCTHGNSMNYIFTVYSLGIFCTNTLCFILFRESTKATGEWQKFQEKVSACSCKNDFLLACPCRKMCTVISETTFVVCGG